MFIPDLKINKDDIRLSNYNPSPYDTIFVNATIHNIGETNISGIVVGFYEGDTLELNIVDVWGIKPNRFDVILGNPPYNKGGIRSHTGKQLGKKNETF